MSAKYGFIDPDFVIPEDYNVTFKKLSTKPIRIDALKMQRDEKKLGSYQVVIALGGEDYLRVIKEVFLNISKVIAPAKGLTLGKAMEYIKSISELDRSTMLKKVAGYHNED